MPVQHRAWCKLLLLVVTSVMANNQNDSNDSPIDVDMSLAMFTSAAEITDPPDSNARIADVTPNTTPDATPQSNAYGTHTHGLHSNATSPNNETVSWLNATVGTSLNGDGNASVADGTISPTVNATSRSPTIAPSINTSAADDNATAIAPTALDNANSTGFQNAFDVLIDLYREGVFLDTFYDLWTHLVAWTMMGCAIAFGWAGVRACRVTTGYNHKWLWLPLTMMVIGSLVGFFEGAFVAALLSAMYMSIPYPVGVDVATGLGLGQAMIIIYCHLGRADFIQS